MKILKDYAKVVLFYLLIVLLIFIISANNQRENKYIETNNVIDVNE